MSPPLPNLRVPAITPNLHWRNLASIVEKHGSTIQIQGAGGRWLPESCKPALSMYPAIFPLQCFSSLRHRCLPDSNLLLHNVGLNPTRTAILDVLASMGAALQVVSLRSAHGEIVGDLSVKGTSLKGGVVEKEQIPLVIDELPMLAALGPYTEEGIEIRDAAELRVKESDRIAALAENLRRMGATVEERPDGFASKAAKPDVCAAPRSIRTEIIASPWPLRSPAWRPTEPPPSVTQTVPASPIRSFIKIWNAWRSGKSENPILELIFVNRDRPVAGLQGDLGSATVAVFPLKVRIARLRGRFLQRIRFKLGIDVS